MWFTPPLSGQVTESPTTVSPGHFQLRIDAVSLRFEKGEALPEGAKYSAIALGSTYFTTGLTSRSDLQLGAELFLREKLKIGGGLQTQSGVGSFYIRPKWTFWIDPSSQALAAVMPYVRIPGRAIGPKEKKIEGGIIVPWEMFLGGGLRAGAMAQWDFVRNDDDTGYDSKLFGTFTVQSDWGRFANIYLETALTASTAGLDRSTLNAGLGLTVQLTSLLQADAAVYTSVPPSESNKQAVLRLRWKW